MTTFETSGAKTAIETELSAQNYPMLDTFPQKKILGGSPKPFALLLFFGGSPKPFAPRTTRVLKTRSAKTI